MRPIATYRHDFSALRRDGKIYVDKTPLAEEHGEVFIYLTSEGLSPCSSLEQLESLEQRLVFHATVIGKNGKLLETNEMMVAVSGVSGLTASAPSLSWTAYQNLWKRADTKAAQPVFKSNVPYELVDPGDANNKLTLTFKKDGVVAFAGKIDGASVSGSSQLVWGGCRGATALPDGWYVTIYAPPKSTAKPPFDGWCETFAVTLTLKPDEQNVVKDVTVKVAETAEP